MSEKTYKADATGWARIGDGYRVTILGGQQGPIAYTESKSMARTQLNAEHIADALNAFKDAKACDTAQQDATGDHAAIIDAVGIDTIRALAELKGANGRIALPPSDGKSNYDDAAFVFGVDGKPGICATIRAAAAAQRQLNKPT
jgi:hypothetical protein